MATPQPRRRHRKDDGAPVHPVDRTLRLPVLPQRQSRFGNLLREPPKSGLERLRADIEGSRHVPDVTDLQQRLREITAAARDADREEHGGGDRGGALAHTSVEINLGAARALRERMESESAADPGVTRTPPKLFRRRIRAIRDAAAAAGRQCVGLDGVIGPICTAYEQLLSRALHSAPQLLPADLAVVDVDDPDGDDGPPSIATRQLPEPELIRVHSEVGGSPVTNDNSPLQQPQRNSPPEPSSTKSFTRLQGVTSSATLLGLRSSHSMKELRAAEARAAELAERVDFLERENEELRDQGAAMRAAAAEAGRRLEIASRALQRSQLLEGTSVDELELADAPLPDVPGMTLQVIVASFRRREADLVRQVERLEEALALRDALVAGSAASPPLDP